MFASLFQRVKILTEVLPAVQSLIPIRTKYTFSRKKVCGVWNKRSGKPIKKNQRPIEENTVRSYLYNCNKIHKFNVLYLPYF